MRNVRPSFLPGEIPEPRGVAYGKAWAGSGAPERRKGRPYDIPITLGWPEAYFGIWYRVEMRRGFFTKGWITVCLN